MVYQGGTGGGESVDVAGLGLSDLYVKVLQVVGTVNAVGLGNVANPTEVG